MAKHNTGRFSVALACAVFAIPMISSLLYAVTTQFWSTSTYEDFAKGTFTGVSLSRDGTMSVAPQLKEVFSTDQSVVWSVVRDAKGNAYLGTGHSGKVFKVDRDGKGSVFFESTEADVFALGMDKKGNLYAGTSPDGKIYQIDAAGKSHEFFDPKRKYIWSMSFATDGSLYVGTGDKGEVFKVSADGKGEVFYETHQTNVVTVATTSAGDVIAGSEPNGLLYRISNAGKGFILYDSPLAEIHQVAIDTDGTIYAAAMGSRNDLRLGGPQVPVPGQGGPIRTTTSITVRAQQGPGQGTPGEGDSAPSADSAASTGADASAAVAAAVMGRRGAQAGAGQSSIYKITPDGAVDKIWESRRENVFDLLVSGKRLLISTDDKGRIYELTPDRRASLLTSTDQEETTRLMADQNSVLAVTGNLGKAYRLGTQPADSGTYESEVRDTGGVSTWGRARWTADTPKGSSLEIFTRSGNSTRPDATWSDWSSAYKNAAGEQITSPSARFIQWRAVLHSADGNAPTLREVEIPYLARNQAPTLEDLKVTQRAEKASPGANAGGNAAAGRGVGYAVSMRAAPQRGFDISWKGTDPDQDTLTYNLYFRGEGESQWKLLESNLKQNYYQLSSDTLPDGKYRLRVVASDELQNAASSARTAETISAPFDVDNAAPKVELVENEIRNGNARSRFHVTDTSGVLTRAEYVIDAGDPVVLVSDDGIIDSSDETFTLVLPTDGHEHLLSLRVYDETGNVGVGKALWAISATASTKK